MDANGVFHDVDVVVGMHSDELFKEVYRSNKTTPIPDIFKDFRPKVTLEIKGKIY